MELFIALASEQRQQEVSLSTPLATISDEYGRLGVWGANSGADRTGRGSIDDRLRGSAMVHTMIAQLLKSLSGCLIKGMFSVPIYTPHLRLTPPLGLEMANSSPQPSAPLEENSDALSVDSGSISDGSSLPSDETRSSRSSLDTLLSVIFGQVQALYESSAILRRPAIPDRYIRSISKDETSISNIFGWWDRAHVAEKVTQWYLDCGRKLEEPFEHGHYLCMRLAAGNTRRREQLRYWQRHPEHGSSTTVIVNPRLPTLEEVQIRHVHAEAPAEMAAVEKAAEKSVALSRGTLQSFSTVAQSVLKDTATVSGRPKTTYAPSDHRPSAKELRLPDLPKPEAGELTVACPYCSTRLNVREMTSQRQLWK